MAKGKSANPMDAYRKAQRKKELKKNKAGRAKARDFALVKKDTRDLEDDIAKLESASELSGADKTRLAELKSELEKINKKKEEYVEEHPEHRRLVFKSRKTAESRDEKDQAALPQKRNLFKKNGLPRHPERSIYYDPVMNPFGVPPPGLPYVERALLPNEVDSEAEERSDEEEDIVMPEGPPPEEDGSNNDDDIPMPEGPPPPKSGEQVPLPPPPPTGSAPMISPPLPCNMPPLPLPYPPPSLPLMSPPSGVVMPPLPPPAFPMVMQPPLPPGFPAMPMMSIPPPPPGFPPFPPTQMQPQMPPPPPGFYPRRGSHTATIQDPLSSIPHQTYQAHRAAKAAGSPTLPRNPSLPPKPTSGGVRLSTSGPSPAPSASAVISAEPELRDFKKESTAFVPATLKRKRASGTVSKVNAAPTVGHADDNSDEAAPAPAVRPDLLSALQDKLGAPPVKKTKKDQLGKETQTKPKDDYDKFLQEMSDVLGPT